MSGTAIGSVTDVLETFSNLADTIDSIPPRCREAMLASCRLVAAAGMSFFKDGGLMWQRMLATSTVHATKPTQLAPPENGGHAHMADLMVILADTRMKIIKDELVGFSSEPTMEQAAMAASMCEGPSSQTDTEAACTNNSHLKRRKTRTRGTVR